MPAGITYDTRAHGEQTSILVAMDLVDEHDEKIERARLTTARLTLYAVASHLVLNGLFEHDILDVPGDRGTFTDPGHLDVLLRPADSPVLDDGIELEAHRARIEYTYDDGQKAGRHEVEIYVLNKVLATEPP